MTPFMRRISYIFCSCAVIAGSSYAMENDEQIFERVWGNIEQLKGVIPDAELRANFTQTLAQEGYNMELLDASIMNTLFPIEEGMGAPRIVEPAITREEFIQDLWDKTYEAKRNRLITLGEDPKDVDQELIEKVIARLTEEGYKTDGIEDVLGALFPEANFAKEIENERLTLEMLRKEENDKRKKNNDFASELIAAQLRKEAEESARNKETAELAGHLAALALQNDLKKEEDKLNLKTIQRLQQGEERNRKTQEELSVKEALRLMQEEQRPRYDPYAEESLKLAEQLQKEENNAGRLRSINSPVNDLYGVKKTITSGPIFNFREQLKKMKDGQDVHGLDPVGFNVVGTIIGQINTSYDYAGVPTTAVPNNGAFLTDFLALYPGLTPVAQASLNTMWNVHQNNGSVRALLTGILNLSNFHGVLPLNMVEGQLTDANGTCIQGQTNRLLILLLNLI